VDNSNLYEYRKAKSLITTTNYLTHEFIGIPGNRYDHICKKCQLIAFMIYRDSGFEAFEARDFKYPLNITCEEYIIKSIIE
jgi:hypothetical protein